MYCRGRGRSAVLTELENFSLIERVPGQIYRDTDMDEVIGQCFFVFDGS